MEKVLVINGSHRATGSTSDLVDLFKNALDDKIKCNVMNLVDYQLDYFNYEGEYGEEDKFLDIIDEVIESDMVVLAAPIYWYTMPARMKTFFDRITNLFSTERYNKLKGKKIVLLFTHGSPCYNESYVESYKATCDYIGLSFMGYFQSQGTRDGGVKCSQEELNNFVKKLNSGILSEDG